MGKKWEVELRTTCKICGKPLPNARYRTFCSKECRQKSNNLKQTRKGYNVEWQRKKRDEIASIPDPNKVQCLICGKWYVQVCSHVYQVHGLTGREYRELFDLEVKAGVTPEWYHKLKGDIAIANETYKNLENGAKFRYVKGDEKAGKYKRSHVTMERIKTLHKYNKIHKS